MFETLFKRPTVLARYREGPLSDARERFLEQCAAGGYSRSMLQKIAWVLLALADRIDIAHDKVTARDIELAVDGRTRFKCRSKCVRESESSHQLFVHVATEWVRSLGCLEPLPEVNRPFAAQIATFARHLRDERGLSPVTISTRCERLAWFFESLHPPRHSLRTISIADVDAFVEEKGNRGWRRSSLSSLASSLRSFFRFAEGQDWCSRGIAAVIESPRLYAQEGLPKGPSWEVVQRLLASTRGDRPADIRDHPILMLMAVYGLRRGEVARLTLDDLDWIGERIVVSRPKQRRTQCYPLLPALGEAIIRYLREVRPRCAHRALFLVLSAPLRPLSASSITQIARARLSALGVTSSPRAAHCLRHACAGHLLASGFSLKQIGDHLGHRSANSTLSYTKIDLAGLREVAELDLGGLL
ncbi:MAG: tyrosine-type recombinase/integrase [Candidatus Eisenbacteria sp.]|nr:tyrosine-type recombinase/integrase [Candidatus Eisenbacteria bacterium]